MSMINKNWFTRLPGVTISLIGTYLTYTNAVKVSILQKKFIKDLFTFQTSASILYKQNYTTFDAFYSYKIKFLKILINLLENNPNIKSIKLDFIASIFKLIKLVLAL